MPNLGAFLDFDFCSTGPPSWFFVRLGPPKPVRLFGLVWFGEL